MLHITFEGMSAAKDQPGVHSALQGKCQQRLTFERSQSLSQTFNRLSSRGFMRICRGLLAPSLVNLVNHAFVALPSCLGCLCNVPLLQMHPILSTLDRRPANVITVSGDMQLNVLSSCTASDSCSLGCPVYGSA